MIVLRAAIKLKTTAVISNDNNDDSGGSGADDDASQHLCRSLAAKSWGSARG